MLSFLIANHAPLKKNALFFPRNAFPSTPSIVDINLVVCLFPPQVALLSPHCFCPCPPEFLSGLTSLIRAFAPRRFSPAPRFLKSSSFPVASKPGRLPFRSSPGSLLSVFEPATAAFPRRRPLFETRSRSFSLSAPAASPSFFLHLSRASCVSPPVCHRLAFPSWAPVNVALDFASLTDRAPGSRRGFRPSTGEKSTLPCYLSLSIGLD